MVRRCGHFRNSPAIFSSPFLVEDLPLSRPVLVRFRHLYRHLIILIGVPTCALSITYISLPFIWHNTFQQNHWCCYIYSSEIFLPIETTFMLTSFNLTLALCILRCMCFVSVNHVFFAESRRMSGSTFSELLWGKMETTQVVHIPRYLSSRYLNYA